MKVTLYTLLLLFCCQFASAQYDQNFKALGDKAFKVKNFYEAAYYYRKAADQMNIAPQGQEIPYQARTTKKVATPSPADVNYLTFQLAESYRGYENYLEAEGWYYKVLNSNAEGDHPLARYWYGVCLRANQHFDNAIKQLTQFKDGYRGEGDYVANANKEIANCKFAIDQYKYPMLMESMKLKGEWNSDGSNYAMITRDDNFYFTSSRLVKDDKRRLNKLYKSTGKGVPQIIDLKIEDEKKNEEYGTPALNPDGSKMYFTRWYKEGAKTVCNIFKMEMTGGVWGTAKALNSNINLQGFNALQPFVTIDGKRLYFVSDKPGGQGGQDIWFAELDGNGEPINSTNVGASINTDKDEQSPYYDLANKRLVYASKGMVGLGGFDLYESQGDMGYFSKPKNMGYPINSAKDDLYYQPDKNNDTQFYMSSDRESDCCLELFQMTDKRYILAGLVTDCDAKKPLPGVKVSFIDSISKDVVAEMTTGKGAKYNFRVATTRPFQMRLEKEKYFSKVLPVTRPKGQMLNDTLMSPEVCLQPFEVNRPIVIANVLYDYAKADLRQESKEVLNGLVTIMKDNPNIKVELSAHTDSVGSDAYNNNLSQARAQSCVDYIVSSGVDSTRIFAKGYGKTKPTAPNSLPNGADNPEGRQLNRRTEFMVLKLENTITKVNDQ
ncbi:OmpA family protein [Mucilaginibacter myungsuensis]|uniref:OmpA family protein n=1 Tax=Mucilaginibacter myungsuensis TaxID=649104 RepID=A0A929KSS3_9SPHI|nr:OmpA family protein [Mucilaginibacter myungsuensis]MBE9660866.1 OmpA family protein [Mucilaginibacter myungsuensis]MDN3600913.1 OmpA family protein [Mucilaginibacter myungsuensis]